MKSFIHSFILLSVLRQLHRLFKNYFSTECNLVLPLSIYSIVSFWKSSNSCLFLISRLPVTFIFLSIFSSTRFLRSNFLRKKWPIPLVFLLLVVCRIFQSSLTLRTTSFFTGSIQLPSSAPYFSTSQVFMIYFLKCPSFSTIQSYDPNVALE